jgi:hypothetical protein
VLWDGTDPVDSQALGQRLNRSRWVNQVRTGDQLAVAQAGQPAVLQPAGANGFTENDALMFRGMFELPQAVLGQPLHGDSSGHGGEMVAVSGHGVPGFMFSESIVPIGMSRPIETTASDWRSSIGHWQYASHPRWASPAPKVALFSACRQLQGQPQQFYWSEVMRSADPVRMILSYHETAPAAGTSAAINRRFMRNLRQGQTFIDAWRHAHPGARLGTRWAALCFEASKGDTMTAWIHKGEPPSHPDPSATILYFDEKNPAGRAVVEPRQEVDCWLTPRGSADRLPPWYLCANGAQVDLHIRLLDPAARLQPGDHVFVVASQVRPDYAGPFRIEDLFTFEAQSAMTSSGVLTSSRRIHGASPGFGDDTYGLEVRPTGPTAPGSGGQELSLPIRLGHAQNEHIPLYYFHIAIRGPGGRGFGMKGTLLEDDFQFGMFRLPWP